MQLAAKSSREATLQLAIRVSLGLLAAFGAWRAARWVSNARTEEMIDVDVYAAAGKALLSGADIYGAAGTAHNLPYLYTPFGAGLFAPLHLPAIDAMHVAWTILLLAALFYIAHASIDYAAPHLTQRYGLLIGAGTFGAALALEPIAQNLKFGQINILIAAAIIADLRGKTWKLPQGTLIGLVAAIKLTPLLFAVYLFLIGKRHATKVAVVVFTLATALGFAMSFGPSVTYWTSVAYDTSRVGVAFVTNQSLNGFFARILGGPEHVNLLYKVPMLAVGAIGIFTAVRATRNGHRMLGDTVCALTALLVSPISWSHHWVWAIPVLAWLAFATDRPRWGVPAAIAGFVLFWVSPIQWVERGDGHEYHYNFLEVLQGNAYLIGGLIFLFALVITVRRQRVASY